MGTYLLRTPIIDFDCGFEAARDGLLGAATHRAGVSLPLPALTRGGADGAGALVRVTTLLSFPSPLYARVGAFMEPRRGVLC